MKTVPSGQICVFINDDQFRISRLSCVWGTGEVGRMNTNYMLHLSTFFENHVIFILYQNYSPLKIQMKHIRVYGYNVTKSV